MDENEFFKKRIIDLSRTGFERGIYTYSDFLTLAQQSDLVMLAASGQLYGGKYVLFGGYEGAERVMASFSDEETIGYDRSWPISCIKITPLNQKFSDELSHRDVLGSLMNLGLERQLMGDILLINEPGHICAYVFVKDHIAKTIIDELTRIKHTTVSCALVEDIDEIPSPKLSDITLQVKSERIDLIIAHVYKLSRSQAAGLFADKKVFIGGRLNENESHLLKEDDLVSVRGYGRFTYRGISGNTRKGNKVVTLSLYI